MSIPEEIYNKNSAQIPVPMDKLREMWADIQYDRPGLIQATKDFLQDLHGQIYPTNLVRDIYRSLGFNFRKRSSKRKYALTFSDGQDKQTMLYQTSTGNRPCEWKKLSSNN